MKLELVPEWKLAWRYWSVRFSLLGAALFAYITAVPDAVLQAWSVLPDEFKGYLPQQYLKWITIAIFILATVSRVVKQPKVEEKHIEKQIEKAEEEEAKAEAEHTEQGV